LTFGARVAAPRGLLLTAIIIAAAVCARGLGYRELMPLRAGFWLPMLEAGVSSPETFWQLFDLVAIVASLTLARLLQSGSIYATDHSALLALLLIGAIQLAVFWLTGLYRRAWRHAGLDDAIAMARAIALAMAAETVVVIAAPAMGLSVATLILDAYLLTTMVLGARMSFRMAEHLFQRERREGRRVLIYGAGRAGTVALEEIRAKPALAMTAVGFLDDDPDKWGNRLRGISIYRLSELPDLIRDGAFDLVAISSRKITAARERGVIDQCERAGLAVIRFEAGWFPVASIGIETVAAKRRADAVGVPLDVAGAQQ
jgi:FlaA1/EpsC-like NDP-sugar epimerase